MIKTILDNDDYLFQHISDGNKKLLIYIKSAPTEEDKLDNEKHNLESSKIDLFCKTILDQDYDIIYIRSKKLLNMYDVICDIAFEEIAIISKTYEIVDGWFVCGGSVLGLYFSKLINYRKIFCISSRFIQRMTLNDTPEFKYKNYKVTPSHINQNAMYYLIYNKYQINDFDEKTAQWLRVNTHNNCTYVYDNKESNFHDKHLLEQQVYLRKYLKHFIPNILNDNILGITGMIHEKFN